MIVIVQPSDVYGTVHAPASKSAMQRACAAALIRKGETVIHNPGNSSDDKAAIEVIQQLGAVVTVGNKQLTVISKGVISIPGQLNCGESGLGIRMFTPIAALISNEIIISGEGSLLNRPMHFFDEILPLLDVKIRSNGGKLPLTIQGPLQPKNIEVDGSLSSQFLTGLLMAYSAANAKDVTIIVNNLKSKPYIGLTLQVMKALGLKAPVNNNYRSFYFDDLSINPQPSTINHTIEGDWSGTAFLLVAGAVAGSVKVNSIDHASAQADKLIVDVLLKAGAEVFAGDDFIEVKKIQLKPFEFDATDCPDLFPPLVALAANCKGISRIKGLKRLKHKESDRGKTLQQEFDKLHTKIELNDDEMLVHGNERIIVKDHQLSSHHDHRIAMACAVACLNADKEVVIKDAGAVKKSYPDFWDHLKQLNAVLSLKPFTTDNTYRL